MRAHLRRLTTDELLRSTSVTHGRLDYEGADIYLELSSRQEFHRLHSCRKEPWTVRWIERYLKTGEVLYDVGANVGAYTVLAAVAAPGCRVVAFEPAAANLAALVRNVELNDAVDAVTTLPVALGAAAGTASFANASTVPGESAQLREGTARSGPRVLVDRLDDLIDRYELPAPNHLKLDVDGAERAVLAGGSRAFGDRCLRSVMAELDPETGTDLIGDLEQLGFELQERASGTDRAAGMPTYGLFVRP